MSEIPNAQWQQTAPQPANSHFLSYFISWTIIIACVGFVMVRVNGAMMARSAHERAAATRPTSRVSTLPAAAEANASDKDNLDLRLISRYVVGARSLLPQQNAKDAAGLLKQVDTVAKTREDRVRAAIVAGEVAGAGEALQRLDEIDSGANDHDDPTMEALQTIYTSSPADLDPAQRQALVKQLGWYGRLALAFGAGADDPARTEVLRPAKRTLVGLVVVLLVGVLIAVVGLGLLITAMVMILTGKLRPRFVPVPPLVATPMGPAPGPPAFLEAFAIYIAGFVLFSFALHLLVKDPPLAYSAIFTLVLPVALMWPVLRGMRWGESRFGFGWHTGSGVITEIGCGIAGYLAGVPALVVAFIVTLTLSKVAGVRPTHPATEYFTKGGWQIAMLYFIACVWAPIMEETMFRGALYNHLRSHRWSWLISAAIVGFIFAAIHPQGWTLIPVLGTIGAVLACIREWRGSLIGSITAHALSNGLVVTLGVTLLGN
jgi:membrane protease YdiL (CAAX protease family)